MDGNYGARQNTGDKPREQNLLELIAGLDDIEKAVADLGGRIRIAADRIDGGKPRDATAGAQATPPAGGPLAYDLNRRGNAIRASLRFAHEEMQRLEAGLGYP